MSNFEAIKADLKEKWLDYYAVNRAWISRLMNENSKWSKCSDGYRPIAWLILGAISYTEEPLTDFMLPFCELQSDPDKLIKVLGLDFDPDEELEKRVKSGEENQQNILSQSAEVIGLLSEDPEYLEAHQGLEEIRAQIRQQENSS